MPYVFSDTGWGVDIERIGGEHGGAYKVNAVIRDYDTDFSKLRYPEIRVDREESARLLDTAQRIFADILQVRQRNAWWWTLGLTSQYIDLRGFEEFLCDFILEPDWIKRMMGFLCDGMMERLDYLEAEGLLSQNNGNTYVGSGGFGYTNDISQAEPGHRILTGDMWGFVESQETVSVDPDAYGELIFPSHKKITERFALNCYGCCEPYEPRWKYARQIRNLRRVSCSPWSDRSKTEEFLGRNYVASIKLAPTPLAIANMDEAAVRNEIRRAVENSVNCIAEFVMKDNNTLGGNPYNAIRWVEIAREEIARVHG